MTTSTDLRNFEDTMKSLHGFIQMGIDDVPGLLESLPTVMTREALEHVANLYFREYYANRRRVIVARIEHEAQQKRAAQLRAENKAYLANPEGKAEVKAREKADLARREERRKIDAKYASKTAKELTSIVENYAHTVRMEWTEQLLGSTFKLNDGTELTWGKATRDQHQTRVNEFKARALVNAEGAFRHAQALSLLESTGTSTLNEAVRKLDSK